MATTGFDAEKYKRTTREQSPGRTGACLPLLRLGGRGGAGWRGGAQAGVQ